eukprot:351596-Chlamydomonas_euryale.AAC.11
MTLTPTPTGWLYLVRCILVPRGHDHPVIALKQQHSRCKCGLLWSEPSQRHTRARDAHTCTSVPHWHIPMLEALSLQNSGAHMIQRRSILFGASPASATKRSAVGLYTQDFDT